MHENTVVKTACKQRYATIVKAMQRTHEAGIEICMYICDQVCKNRAHLPTKFGLLFKSLGGSRGKSVILSIMVQLWCEECFIK